MGSVSTRLDDETEEEIREKADERDVSIAEVVRELIEKGREHDRLKAENERLKQEKEKLIAQLEGNQELAEYVSEEQERLQRLEKKQNAPIWRKFYWAAFGKGNQNIFSDDDEENR